MKKIFMMAVMAVAALTANAQNEVGQFSLMPKFGINIANLTGDSEYKMSDLMTLSKKSKVGFVGGVEAEYGVAKNFGITAGVLYSMQGAKFKCDIKEGIGTTTTKVNLGYINVPILAQYYVVKGLAIKAGIQPAFAVSKKINNEVSLNGEYAQISGEVEKEMNKQTDKMYPKDNIKTFDFSIPVGISYEYANVVLDARYNIGLTKTMKDAEKNKNSVFQITLGYKFKL